jgi:hypothetical protein
VGLGGSKIVADDLFGTNPVVRRLGGYKTAAQHDECKHRTNLHLGRRFQGFIEVPPEFEGALQLVSRF